MQDSKPWMMWRKPQKAFKARLPKIESQPTEQVKLYKYEGDETMELKIEASKKIADGVHNGVIIDVQYRDDPYEYTDVVIELPEKVQVKASYPTMVCPTSKLGRLLMRFGERMDIGSNIDPNKVLTGKKVVFQTTSEDKGGVKYSKVLTESLQPAM